MQAKGGGLDGYGALDDALRGAAGEGYTDSNCTEVTHVLNQDFANVAVGHAVKNMRYVTVVATVPWLVERQCSNENWRWCTFWKPRKTLKSVRIGTKAFLAPGDNAIKGYYTGRVLVMTESHWIATVVDSCADTLFLDSHFEATGKAIVI